MRIQSWLNPHPLPRQTLRMAKQIFDGLVTDPSATVEAEQLLQVPPEVDSSCWPLIVPLFRGRRSFESLILSHHSRFTRECHKELMNDDL